MTEPVLLTIAIPTWNRAAFLQQTLSRIQNERLGLAFDEIELLVCDNASSDATVDVIASASSMGPAIRHVRHAENLGSDRNIAECFNLARGRYVWILGDDDFPTLGTLDWLLGKLRGHAFALVFLRPYGYEVDGDRENPGGRKGAAILCSTGEFLSRVAAQITFISSIVVNKSILTGLDATVFCGSNLVQVEVYLSALVRSDRFLFCDTYRVACKRNNSGGYDFSEVFVDRLGRVMDQYRGKGLRLEDQEQFEKAMIVGYFPQNILRTCLVADRRETAHGRFKARFSKYLVYWIMIDPIFSLPYPLARIWGGLATLIGRSLRGDLRRGFAFAVHRFRRFT